MAKARAAARAERERLAAIAAAEQAQARARAARRQARRRRLTGWLPRWRTTPGLLARRRRRQWWAVLVILLVLNALVWLTVTGGDRWAARVGALVVSLLVAPVLDVMLFRRR